MHAELDEHLVTKGYLARASLMLINNDRCTACSKMADDAHIASSMHRGRAMMHAGVDFLLGATALAYRPTYTGLQTPRPTKQGLLEFWGGGFELFLVKARQLLTLASMMEFHGAARKGIRMPADAVRVVDFGTVNYTSGSGRYHGRVRYTPWHCLPDTPAHVQYTEEASGLELAVPEWAGTDAADQQGWWPVVQVAPVDPDAIPVVLWDGVPCIWLVCVMQWLERPIVAWPVAPSRL